MHDDPIIDIRLLGQRQFGACFLAMLGTGQVNLLAYVDVFWTLSVIGAIMIPVALSLRSINLKAPARGH